MKLDELGWIVFLVIGLVVGTTLGIVIVKNSIGEGKYFISGTEEVDMGNVILTVDYSGYQTTMSGLETSLKCYCDETVDYCTCCYPFDKEAYRSGGGT